MRYLGEIKAQDQGMAEIVTDKRVPRCVFMYLRFLSAREIQRKRNYLFAQGQPTPSVKQWKQKLRDDLRRRIKCFLQRDPSAMIERPVEECSVPVGKATTMQQRKIAAKERGVNLNQTSQRRKRQKQANSTGAKPVEPLCDQAKELITRFENACGQQCTVWRSC